MLRSVRPDLLIHPLSGNVDTQAAQARCRGERRPGPRGRRPDTARPARPDRPDPAHLARVPAPGQGALALQCRAGDGRTIEALARLDDPATRVAVEAERAFLAATGGGLPLADRCRRDRRRRNAHAPCRSRAPGRAAGPRSDDGPGSSGSRPPGRRDDGIAIATDLAARVVRLRGRARILVTRPDADAAPLADALGSRGLEAVVIPTIDVRDEPPAVLVDALVALDGGRVVATSPNGVRTALVAATAAGIAPADLGWAVTGSASAAPLRARGIEPWLPPRPDAGSIAESLPVAPGERILLVRGDLADPIAGARARRARCAGRRGDRLSDRRGTGGVARGHLRRARRADRRDRRSPAAPPFAASWRSSRRTRTSASWSIPFVCIGRTTAGVARDLGLATVSDASDPTPDSLADAVVRVLSDAAGRPSRRRTRIHPITCQLHHRRRDPMSLDTRPPVATDIVVEPAHRLRRTRRTDALRSFVRETRIHPRNLVAPLFVQPGSRPARAHRLDARRRTRVARRGGRRRSPPGGARRAAASSSSACRPPRIRSGPAPGSRTGSSRRPSIVSARPTSISC